VRDVVSAADGSWAALVSPSVAPLTKASLSVTVDEDTVFDIERDHRETESVSFVVFERGSRAFASSLPTPSASASRPSTPSATPTATVGTDLQSLTDACWNSSAVNGIVSETRELSTIEGWMVVPLFNNYTQPVIVCTSVYASGADNYIAMLRNVGPESFEIRGVVGDNVVGTQDGERVVGTAAVGAVFWCLIVEEGALGCLCTLLALCVTLVGGDDCVEGRNVHCRRRHEDGGTYTHVEHDVRTVPAPAVQWRRRRVQPIVLATCGHRSGDVVHKRQFLGVF
jgi:hypothetical protein